MDGYDGISGHGRFLSLSKRKTEMANVIKSIAKYIERNPDSDEAAVLRDLCACLEQESSPFDLQRLFGMKTKAFELALELMDEWRFDRHIAGRRLQKYLGKGDD